ncbi:hypothetical protein ACNO5E_14165 [Vibrio parahaemolyticus]
MKLDSKHVSCLVAVCGLFISGCNASDSGDSGGTGTTLDYATNIWVQPSDNNDHLISVTQSENDTFKVSYQNTTISNAIYNAYVELDDINGSYTQTSIQLSNLSSTSDLNDVITGTIFINPVDSEHVSVTFTGVSANTGLEVNINNETLVASDIYRSGRVAKFNEITRAWTPTNSNSRLTYQSNGELTITDGALGCTYTVIPRVSGFRIWHSRYGDYTGYYHDWAFDFDMTTASTNCEVNKSQSGVINIHYDTYSGFDQIEVLTNFKHGLSSVTGFAPVSDRPIRD